MPPIFFNENIYFSVEIEAHVAVTTNVILEDLQVTGDCDIRYDINDGTVLDSPTDPVQLTLDHLASLAWHQLVLSQNHEESHGTTTQKLTNKHQSNTDYNYFEINKIRI